MADIFPSARWRRAAGRLLGAGLALLAALAAAGSPQRAASQAQPAPVVSVERTYLYDNGGNNDGVFDPGEPITMFSRLRNSGDRPATGVRGQISILSGGAAIQNGSAPYPDIGLTQAVTATEPFSFQINASHPCGAPVVVRETISFNTNLSISHTVTLPIGAATEGEPASYVYTQLPQPIPDNSPQPLALNLPLSAAGSVHDMNVNLTLSHGYDEDLEIQLRAPDGRQVQLAMRRGGAGNDYTNTVFDDEATVPIDAGSPPFTGRFRPEDPLSLLDGLPIAGTWSLLVHDRSQGDSGTVGVFALEITPRTFRCTPSNIPISGLTASNDGPTLLGQPTALQATIAAGTGVAYSWTFGDGATGSGPSPTHTYASAGTYAATVTASNALGSATSTTTVIVRTTPPDEFVYLPLLRR